ncbi:MAG: M24 family metallopeptidase [Archaeoglobi archaeon]|nr:M24 family metallopeptidase [Candidatus Mnemosynella sp.]
MSEEAFLIIGDSVRCEDLFYFTHFLSEDEFAYLRIGEEELILISPMELERAEKESRVSASSFRDYGKDLEDAVIEILKSKRVQEISIPSYFPVSFAERMKNEGMKIRIVGEISERRVKSEEEIERIRVSQRIAGETLNLLLRILKRSRERGEKLYYGGKPLTSERLKKIAGLKLASLSASCEMMIVSSGTQSAIPHHRGEGEISSSEPVLVDIFPKHSVLRYHGDLTRTFVKGEASEDVKDAFYHVLNAQKIAISMVSEGASCREIHLSVRDYFEEHGYESDLKNLKGFIHSTGHGIGLRVHEPPSISDNNEILECGNVVTVEPGLYFPGEFGVRIEDVLVVRKSSAEIIESGAEKILEV